MKSPLPFAPESHRGASRPVVRISRWGFLRRLVFPLALMLLLLSVLHIGGLTLRAGAEAPIRQVQINGDLRHLDQRELETIVRSHLDAGFFLLDLQQLRDELESLPWVQEASVKRHWPDRLQILITEQVPVLRWGENALLNPFGEVFRPVSVSLFNQLPMLDGPVGSERMMLDRFDTLLEQLAPQGQGLRSLHLDGKHSWSLVIKGGLKVVLGRRDLSQRSERLVALLDRRGDVGALGDGVLDLRYSNGFTIAPLDAVAGLRSTVDSKGESG